MVSLGEAGERKTFIENLKQSGLSFSAVYHPSSAILGDSSHRDPQKSSRRKMIKEVIESMDEDLIRFVSDDDEILAWVSEMSPDIEAIRADNEQQLQGLAGG
jgi:hypothetical protein